MFFNSKDSLGDKVFRRFPYIKVDEQILLRDVRLSDAEAYYQYLNQPEVKLYIPDSCLPASAEQAKKELQFFRNLHSRRISIYWAIAETSSGTMIGACGFEKWSRIHKRLELAYDLNPKYWRQGIATKSIHAIIDHAFKIMQVERVEAFLDPSNIASAGLLSKLGFTKEATLKKYRFFKGEHIDIDLYAVTKAEW